MTEPTWKIYYKELDEDGKVVGQGVHPTEYFTLGWANTVARKKYGNSKKFRYIVSQIYPWGEHVGSEECCICGKEFEFPESYTGIPLVGHRVSLTVWDNTEPGHESRTRIRLICPTCGEQLKKCMEENLNDL